MPRISLIIISKDRHALLERTVEALRAHVHGHGLDADTEIVVVEEGDAPTPVPGCVYRFLPRRDLGFGYARNRGLELATGDMLVFADDDVRPSPNWLPRLTAAIQGEGVVAAGGGIVPDPEELGRWGAALAALGLPAGGPARILQSGPEPVPTGAVSSGNCAFRRSVLDRVPGFQESLRTGAEDSEFFNRLRALGAVCFAGGAFVFHVQRERGRDVWRWAVRRGRAYFGRDVCESGPLRGLLGPASRSLLPKVAVLAAAAVAVGAALGAVWGACTFFLLFGAWVTVIAWRVKTRLTAGAPAVRQELAEVLHVMQARHAWVLAPLVRFTVDFGEQWGRVKGFCLYLYRRWWRAPFILTLHRLGTASADPYTVPVHEFQALVQELQTAGYRLVRAGEIAQRLQECPHSLFLEPIAALTFDDADETVHEPLAGLAHQGVAASLFAVTGALGQETAWEEDEPRRRHRLMPPAQLRQLAEAGIEVGGHTHGHVNLQSADAATQERELEQSASVLQELLGRPASGMAYPYGGFNPSTTPRLAAGAGFRYALSSIPGCLRLRSDLFHLPRLPVLPGDGLRDVRRRARGWRLRDWYRDLRDWLRGGRARSTLLEGARDQQQ